MVTVNTGRQIFQVKQGQIWKSLDPRDDGRTVSVEKIDHLRVYLKNRKTGRKSRKFLQDFVLVFQLLSEDHFVGM